MRWGASGGAASLAWSAVPHVPPADGNAGESVAAYAAPLAGSTAPAGLAMGARVAVRALFTLNELHSELLVSCTADGAVRVWRGYAARGQQSLATSWQAVLLAASAAVSAAAAAATCAFVPVRGLWPCFAARYCAASVCCIGSGSLRA